MQQPARAAAWPERPPQQVAIPSPPAALLLQSFDEMLLLKRGGEVIYNGALGNEAENLVSYLSALPNVPAIQPGTNPANWCAFGHRGVPACALDRGLCLWHIASSQSVFQQPSAGTWLQGWLAVFGGQQCRIGVALLEVPTSILPR